ALVHDRALLADPAAAASAAGRGALPHARQLDGARRRLAAVRDPRRRRGSGPARGSTCALFAILGGGATAVAWLVVVVQDAPTRYAGLAWLVAGFVFYPLYRRRRGGPLRATRRRPRESSRQ